MKKFMLFSMILGILLPGFAQQRIRNSQNMTKVEKQMHYQPVMNEDAGFENPVNPTVSNPDSPKDDIQIGSTWYDLQTNGSLGSRLYLHPDNTISAVWMMSNDAAFNDRGTGYNYFDGSSWSPYPEAGIEDVKTGWPSIAPWGTNGEIIVAHTGIELGLLFNKRDTKGTGDWESFFLTGPDAENVLIWPRMTTSSLNHDVIHLITCGGNAVTWNGQTPALFYSKSNDGGNSWDPLHEVIEQTGPDHYININGDQYTWANPVGNTIAFGIVDQYKDWFVMKSTDSGETWQKIIIWEHPYPFFSFPGSVTTDTLWSPDNSGDVALDADGNVHAVCGLTFWYKYVYGDVFNFFPLSDGIIYWNESMPPFTAPDQHDALDPYDVLTEENLIGWSQDMNNNGVLEIGPPYTSDIFSYRSIGLSTMPNIAVSSQNNISVVYASTTEGLIYGNPPQYNYKHIWSRTSHDGGATWQEFNDLTSGLIYLWSECIYPVIAKNSNDNTHVIFQADNAPGESITTLQPPHDNEINYNFFGDYPLITLFPTENIEEAGPGSFTINVYSAISWEVSESCDWLQCEPMSGTGNGLITVNYGFNESTFPRNCTISVFGLSGFASCYFFQDGLTSVDESLITNEIKLYPNPFADETFLNYYISEKSIVRIDLFSITVNKIKELQNATLEPGDHRVTVSGSELSAGIYYYQINAKATGSSHSETRFGRMIKE